MPTPDPVQKRLEQIVTIVNHSEIHSIRGVLTGIIGVINNPKSNAKDLVDLIQIDPPLTAKVLALANSAYYAPRRRIAELGQAVIYIGYEALKEIALRQKVCSLFCATGAANGFSRVLLWKHSVAVAICTKLLFRREFQQRGENAYVAGLLHDIGIIVEDQLLHEWFHRVLTQAGSLSRPFERCELEVFGCDHAQIGAAVCAGWCLPEEIASAIGGHHDPWQTDPIHQQIAATLYVADLACRQRGIGYGNPVADDKTAWIQTMDRLGIHQEALDLILDEVQTEIARMAEGGLL